METPVAKESREILEVHRTACCVVGGGPAGVMLSLLLARRGVDVMLLEAHKDFDREFRGDTIHPAVLEILDELGLADRVHQFRHTKVYGPAFQTANGVFQPFNLRLLKTRFPYILLIPQTQFLEFIAAEAKKYPNFHLAMTANVQEMIEEDGVVRGVRYQTPQGWHEVRADLTVAADGRFSKLRHLAGFEPIRTAPPMDVLWFRLPRLPEDPAEFSGAFGRFAAGHILVILERDNYWQTGFVFPKGRYQDLKAKGLDALRRHIVEIEPRFAPHVEHLRDWQDISLLSVESSRCPLWHKPGLLLIGDAAHVMSPVGGVGINYAIQDAVAAADILADPLKSNRVEERHLAEVQRQQEWPTRVIQAFQSQLQKRMVSTVLRSTEAPGIPLALRILVKLPLLRSVPARLIGFGVRRAHVQS